MTSVPALTSAQTLTQDFTRALLRQRPSAYALGSH